MQKNHWEIVEENKGNIIVSTAPGLWERIKSYFKWCDENPITTKRTITSGKGAGSKVETEFVRPYNIKAMCLHCGITEEYIKDIRHEMSKNSDYYHVISKALYIIYAQNVEMATIGEFNPIFTAKLLNIDKDDTTNGAIKVEISSETPQLSVSENEVLEKLELENKLFENTKDKNS